MQRDEYSPFVYKRWFCRNGLLNFKQDLEVFQSEMHVLEKLNLKEPFSPTNYKWVERQKSLNRPKEHKLKTTRNCKTLVFTVDETLKPRRGGIYRLIFSNGKFYIGSTAHFGKRMGAWVATFNGTSKMHNKNVIKCVAECDSCHFQLIEYIDDEIKLKYAETEYIKTEIGNPLLLNRAYDAVSNKGIRWTDEERLATKNSLIAKYKSGELKATAYKYRASAKKASELFKSKCFGDKE